jgi:hypothetical protein
MKLISYCLWGNNTKYTIGAIKNADLAEKFYPGWVCRFYYSNSVPENIIQELKKRKNTQLYNINDNGNWKFTINRFFPISESGIEYVISRDTDSRITEREVSAVNQWLHSGKDAHIMRDHPYHGGFPMLAGMFGIKGQIIKNIKALLILHNVSEQYHYDQIFLAKYVYPYIENSVILHDEFFSNNPFPIKRIDNEFVGQAFNADDTPCNPEHSELIKK